MPQTTPESTDAWLAERLAALPDPLPPEQLLPRILASRARRRRLRRGLAAAGLALGLALLWPAQPPVTGPALPPQPLADVYTDAERGAPLWLIDRRLQAAYDRGADDAQIAALWQMRARHLAGSTEDVQQDVHQQENTHASILTL